MKKDKLSRRVMRYALSVLLLASVCVGAVELAVCSYQDPDFYQRITAPIREGFQQLAEAGQTVWTGLSQSAVQAASHTSDRFHSGLAALKEHFAPKPEPEPEMDIQLVDDDGLAPPPRGKASFKVTTLAARSEGQFLTGGAREVVYFDQTTERWADQPYGTDHIGGYGCGPTAMAMAVSTLTGDIIDPVQMAQHCVDNGYWARRQGSYLSIVPGVARDFGLECSSLPLDEADEDTIAQYLATGQILVALMGPGHFTNGGHFILLRGITLDGSILVADPASPERSLTTWDLELILGELSANRSSGGPLWVLEQDPFAAVS